MKQFSDYTDIFIAAPFFLGYLWAAGSFCKKFLGASKGREGWFLFLSFCGWLPGHILGRMSFILYSVSVLLGPVFFLGLVVLLFRSGREKRILAASMLMLTVRVVEDFCCSILFCLELFFLHTVKKLPEDANHIQEAV